MPRQASSPMSPVDRESLQQFHLLHDEHAQIRHKTRPKSLGAVLQLQYRSPRDTPDAKGTSDLSTNQQG